MHAHPRSTLVAEVAYGPAVTVEETQSLWDAWQLMFVAGLRSLAVIGKTGACVGVIGDRTILAELPLTEEHLSGRSVGDVMSTPGVVTPASTTHDAAELMSRQAVGAIPVVGEDGRLMGLLTDGDLVAWLAVA